MLKVWPLCTDGKLNLRDRVLGEVEKDSFITWPGKGRHTGLLAWNTMCPPYPSHFFLNRHSCEEIPHAQGKRNPSKMVGVARRHQRADTLKPYSRKTSQSNHTSTIALSNSMKLSHAREATQDKRVMWRGLTECGPLEKGMANHFSILALRTPWTVWKGKMIGYWRRNSPGQ